MSSNVFRIVEISQMLISYATVVLCESVDVKFFF